MSVQYSQTIFVRVSAGNDDMEMMTGEKNILKNSLDKDTKSLIRLQKISI